MYIRIHRYRWKMRSLLVSIRITVTPDHPQFYHPPFWKDSNFLLRSRSFLSISPPPLILCTLFSTVHELNLCLIADYWDFARMKKKREDRRSLDRLSSLRSVREPRAAEKRTTDKDESLILSVVSRSFPPDRRIRPITRGNMG